MRTDRPLLFLLLLLCLLLSLHACLFWATGTSMYFDSLNSRYSLFIPPGLLHRLQGYMFFPELVLLLACFFRKKLAATLTTALHELRDLPLFPQYGNFEKHERKLFILVFTTLLLLRILLMIYEPFEPDEIWSYLAYRNKPIFAPLLWYPIPGNHIFQTFISRCFLAPSVFLPLLLRVPILLISMFSAFYLFRLASLFLSFRAALIAVCFFSLMPMNFYYSIQARGYCFNIFFTISTLYYGYLFILQSKNIYLLLLTGLSVLGFYTIPTFLYNFCTCHACFLLYILAQRPFNKCLFTGFTKSAIATGLISFLVYLPVFVINGMDAVVSNREIKASTKTDILFYLPSYLKKLCSYLLYNWPQAYLLVPVLLITCFFLYSRRTDLRFLLLFILLSLMLPAAFITIQKVLPHLRIFLYLSIGLSLWTGIMAELFTGRIPYLAFTLCCLQLAAFIPGFKTRYERSAHAVFTAKKLMEAKGDCYRFNDSYYAAVFEFEFYKRNRKLCFLYRYEADATNKAEVIRKDGAEKIIYKDARITILQTRH